MKTRRLLLLLMVALSAFAAAPPVPAARAAHGVPLALFDPNSTGWYSIRNMTVADHQDFFDSTAASGYMMIDAERLEISGQLRVSSVWQRNSDSRGWASRSNLTSQEFHNYWEQYRNAGYRLIDQDAYPISGQLHYAGIWVQNVEGLDWASYRNLTSDEFGSYFDDFSRRGFILVDTEAYTTSDGLRYSQIWAKNSDGLGWIALRNMTSGEYADYFDQYAADGYRVLDLESYQVGQAQRYAAIWIKNTNGRGWYAYRDMTAQEYGNRWLQLRDAGYRVIDFEVYDTASGVRYAGVWRQNGDRPNWRLKDRVTALIEGYLADNDIAGLGVAIAVDNQFRYLRGFGHADIALNRVFHSGTIARAASGCKAVTGVLAMRLEEATPFDIDTLTRTYAPSLPAHHTHTVEQLLANRGGVRHYFAGADPTKNVDEHFDTMLEAVELFEDDPLVFAPGTAYGYSSHGSSVAGLAMEEAVGAPFATLLNSYLSGPFNLPTLQVEDRSVPNAQRARLYGGSVAGPVPVVADDVSWKAPGGGCETSVFDYGRLGMLLTNGSLLSPASLARMWTPPDGLANYALGWDTGSGVVAKGGEQTGSRSYIRVYPDEQIVITLISNQRGHDLPQLGRDIGALLLNSAALASGDPPAENDASLAQVDAANLDPPAELGDSALGVALPALPAPSVADDATEPATSAFEEGSPQYNVYLPLIQR